MRIVQYPLPPTQFVPEPTSSTRKYQRVILHNTAGYSATSAIDWWKQTPERVATPYVIDRDGTVYQCYNPADGWAYHLGVGQKRLWWEKTSLGIELVNIGPLVRRTPKRREGNIMVDDTAHIYDWREDFTREYARDATDVIDLAPADSWMGIVTWERYTDAQYFALRALLIKLSIDFGMDFTTIPTRTHLPLTTARLEQTPFTLLSHSNFNVTISRTTLKSTTGVANSAPVLKYDVGPHFEWGKVLTE